MAEKKTTSGKTTRKPAHETRAEAADALRKAAELIDSLNTEAQKKSAATKKPAAKKSTSKAPTKKTTTKSAATKAAPKKTAAKKPAAKKQAPETEPVEQVTEVPEESTQTVETPAPAPIAETQPQEEIAPQPEVQPQAEVAAAQEEQAVAQEPEPTAEPAPVAQPEPEPEPIAEPAHVQPAPVAAKNGFKSGTDNFVNNKGKLPLFIIANLLLVISSVLLIITSFSISYHSLLTGATETRWYSLFGYFSNADVIKMLFAGMAGEWANGGYIIIGILMVLAFLLPLALVVKNVILLIVKKNKDVSMLDAVVSFAFLLAYLGIVNLYGANMTAGHLIAFILSSILLAFTVFIKYIQSPTSKVPVFSLVNIAIIIVCTFLLTATPVYSGKVGIYAGKAAALAGGGVGFSFVLLVVTVLAFILFIIMQLKKLPALLEFIVPAAFGVFALVAVIVMGVSIPDGLSIGVGFVIGCALTILLGIVDVLFAAVGKLRNHKVTVADLTATQTAVVAESENPQAASTAVVVCASCGMENEAGSKFCLKCGRDLGDAQQQTEQPAVAQVQAQSEQPKEPAEQSLKCPACGTENEPGAVFCLKCGHIMK